MLKLQTGRPVSNEGRLEKEIRVYDLPDSLQIVYQRVDHEAAMNMEVCEAIDLALRATISNRKLFLTLAESDIFAEPAASAD